MTAAEDRARELAAEKWPTIAAPSTVEEALLENFRTGERYGFTEGYMDRNHISAIDLETAAMHLRHKANGEILVYDETVEENWAQTRQRARDYWISVARAAFEAVEALVEKDSRMTVYAESTDYWGGVRAAGDEILAALTDKLGADDER